MSKINLFLDLDGTLICALATDEYDFKKYKEKAITNFTFHNMSGYYIIFERPGLQEFLDYVFDHFNVSIWTAASKDYALFIVKEIILTKPERKLDFVFYHYHCKISEHELKSIKNLSLLWDRFKLPGYTEPNTLIFDDCIEVKTPQKRNCIQVPEFVFTTRGSENDTFLRDIVPVLENYRTLMLDGRYTTIPEEGSPSTETSPEKS